MLPEDANNAKNFAEVTVKSDAVEKVTEAKLSNDLTYVTMNDKTVEFKATKGINGLGKEVLPKEGETALDDKDVSFERAVSSDSTVAYVEGGKIVPLKEGNVTFDVYFTNVKEPVKVAVEVKAAQEATSMEKIENMKVQTGEVKLPTVKVLDQYGKAMTAAPVIKVTDKDNKEVQVSQDNKVSLTEAGKYTVKVFASEDKDAKQLGSYTIETVKVDEQTKPEVYELNFTKDDKDKVQDTLDIEGTNKSVVIDVVGKVDGVELGYEKFHTGLDAKASDEAVKATYKDGKITVEFAGGKTPKVGDVTITLYNEEGAMVTDLQTATVKVVNTAAQIEELKLAEEKATALTAVVDDVEALKTIADKQDYFTAANIAEQLTAGKDADDKEIFNAKMVKEVKFIERVIKDDKLTGKVHVTLDAKYGGKTFVFDAEVTTKTPEEPGNGGEEPAPGEGEGDTEAPVITTDAVDGDIKLSELADFVLPTATATDNVDETVEVTTKVTINGEEKTLEEVKALEADATFVVTFTATDAAENEATKSVTYTVVADPTYDVTFTFTEAINAEDVEISYDVDGTTTTATIATATVDSTNTVTVSFATDIISALETAGSFTFLIDEKNYKATYNTNTWTLEEVTP